MRSTLTGGLWGLVLAGAGLGLASQLGELPQTAEPPATPQLTPPLAADTEAVQEVVTAPDVPEEVEAVITEAPAIAPPAIETIAPEPDTAPSAVPEAANLEAVLDVPDEPPTPDVVVSEPAQVETEQATPTAPPQLAAPEPDVAVVAEPAPAPAQDELVEPETDELVAEATASRVEDTAEPDLAPTDADVSEALEGNQVDVVEAEVIEGLPASDASQPVTEGRDLEAASLDPLSEGTDEPDLAASETGLVVEEPDVAQPTEPEASPQVAEIVAPPVVAETPDPVIQDEPDPIVQAPVTVEPPVEAEDPVVSVPDADVAVVEADEGDTPLPGSQTGVRINRPIEAPSSPAGQEAEVVPEIALDEDAPALLRFAAEFENPNDLPIMAFILLDDGQIADAVEQVAALPLPATVILDPLDPGVGERMASYRDAGIEVGMRTSLPAGSTPIDVEVAFEAAFGTVSEAVILFSDGTGVIQNSRSVTEQVMQVLAADGRGFVTMQRGLGNAQRVAEQAEVPSTTVLRDLDGEGQDGGAIERALDQAALRARQTGDAVLLARVTPTTLDALMAWGSDLEADQLAIAPITALLSATLP